MKATVDLLATSLRDLLGPGSVESDPEILGRYGVDGKTAKIICLPEKAEQISAALRACAEGAACVIPWGGGTSTGLGNIPRAIDVILSLERMDGLVEHDDANLTATVQAGMRLARLQEIVTAKNQFLPIDAPHPARATIGGIIAANSNGPRRTFYGGVRDLVVGMRMALATGEQIKAGGKVVKNVAGYDMCKLFVGSLGTLGIITEATVRIAPVPESAATIVARGTLNQCLKLVSALSQSTLLPTAMALLSGETAKSAGISHAIPSVMVRVEGFAEAVKRHLHDIQTMSQNIGIPHQILDEASHQRLWETARDFGVKEEGILYRLTVPLTSVEELLKSIEERAAHGAPVRYLAHPGAGTLWILADPDSSGIARFAELGALAAKDGGHAIVASAPPKLKEGIDVWGPAPPALAIMREIKRQFDPQGILNPGRFIAGL